MREKGDGHLRQRPNGSWEWQFWYQDNDENMVSKSIYGKTKSIANKKKKEFLKNVEKELIPTEQTYAEYLHRWNTNTDLSRESIRGYDNVIRNHITPAIPKVKLTNLRATHIEKIYKELQSKGLSKSSQTLVTAVLSKSLKDAVKVGLIDFNPMSRVMSHPTQPKAKPNPLSILEQRLLIDSETNPEYKNIWTVAINTGMRRGELFGLKWSDIDFDRTTIIDGKKISSPVIKIQRQYHQRWHEFQEPKRDSSREVALLPSVTLALESQRRVLAEKRLKARVWVDNDLVFTNPSGEPKYGNKVGVYLSEKLNQLGIGHRKLHDFRATFATNCMLQGVHIKTVQKWLGHADIKTTLNIYSTSTPEMEIEAANKMAMLDVQAS